MKKQVAEQQTMVSRVKLTPDELDHLRRQTHPGQAHWGCSQRQCRECVHWNEGKRAVYYAATRTLKPRRCAKAVGLMPQVVWVLVPYFAPACKYFKENPAAPPAERGRGGAKARHLDR